MYYRRHKSTGAQIKTRAVLVLLCIVAIVLALDLQFGALIEEMAVVQARIIGSRAINEAVVEVLAQQDVDYSALVTLSSDGQGNVSSLESDIVRINKLKADITNEVTRKLGEYENRTVGIPLGTLLGIDMLTGRGPDIQLQLKMYGSVVTDITGQFEEAGINQTRHQIVCSVQTNVSVILPGFSASTPIDSSFAIAETVIVGEVPDSYTTVNGDMADAIGLVNDYANNQ